MPYYRRGLVLSAKGVWMFEAEDRLQAESVQFDRPIRIRHLTSGKYLSCDTSRASSRGSGQLGETWFDAELVNDADPSMPSGRLGSASSMLFYLRAEIASDDLSMHVPAQADVSVRIEHRFFSSNDSLESVFLHFCGASVIKRPCRRSNLLDSHDGDERTKGFRVVFSTSVNKHSIHRLLSVDESEGKAIDQAVALLPALLLYARLVQWGHDFSEQTVELSAQG